MTPNYKKLLETAYQQAQISLSQGGIPVGAALFDIEGQCLGKGHNQRVQQDDPSIHGETDAFRKAGRQLTYQDKILVTTLSPCWYCSGLVRQFNIGTLVIGDSVNFEGGKQWLSQYGTNIIDLADADCISMMSDFIETNPHLWHEDIGEAQ